MGDPLDGLGKGAETTTTDEMVGVYVGVVVKVNDEVAEGVAVSEGVCVHVAVVEAVGVLLEVEVGVLDSV
jgi:hypothetical protein